MRRYLVPLLLVPVVSLALSAFRPQILTAGFMSWRAFAVTVGVGLAGLLVLGVLWRRSRLVALWTADVVVLALMAAVVWPVFRERTLREDFPATTVVLPRPTTTAGVPASPSASPTVLPSVVRRASGRLGGIGHHAKGTVALYLVDGVTFLRFEQVAIEGTPTPSVRLVEHGRRTPNGGVRIGGLRAEKGSFSYRLPERVELAEPWTVLVWCDRYSVPIAAADLA